MTKLERMVKTANTNAKGINWGKVLYPAAGAVAAAGVTSLAIPAIQKSQQRKRADKAWEALIKKDPSIKNKESKEQFMALHESAPSMMKHPSFSLPILRQSAEYGAGGIPISVLDLVTKTENQGKKNSNPLAVPMNVANLVSNALPKA